MEDGRWKMEDGRWEMGDGEWNYATCFNECYEEWILLIVKQLLLLLVME